MTKTFLPLFCVSAVSAILVTGCKGPEKTVAVNGEAWPATLNYAYSPSTEDPEARVLTLNERVKYLSDYIGIPVRLYETSSYGPTIEAMRSGKVDIATTGSFSFMIAAEKVGVEPLTLLGYRNEDGTVEPGSNYSVIAVPPDSPIHSVEDLKAHASELTFSFSDAASTTGHLLPRDGLQQMGIDPDQDFKRVVFTQSHLNSIMTIIAGKVDAGGIQEGAIQRLIDTGKIKEGDLKIIWRSEAFLRPPLMVRGELPRSLKEKIRSAYLEMDQRDPELFAAIQSRYSSYYPPGMVYVPVYDYMWDNMRLIAKRLKNMKLIEGKTGISDWNEEKRQEFLQQQAAKQEQVSVELASLSHT